MGSRRARGALAAAVLAVLVTASVAMAARQHAQSGTLTLRVGLVGELPSDLVGLEARLAWAGANRGPDRDAYWSRVPLSVPVLDLDAAANTAAARAAAGRLAPGRYDRLFVAAPEIVGVTRDGRRVPLVSHVEPIVEPFEMPAGGTVEADLMWTVLPAAFDSGAPAEVFVRSARLVDGAADAHDQKGKETSDDD